MEEVCGYINIRAGARAHVSKWPRGSEEGIRTPEAEVTCGCETLGMSSRNQTVLLWKINKHS